MRISDYMRLSWDQLRRRKVVTALCAAGISIGCSAIIVAMSLGQSAQIYAEKQMNSFLKMDEITVTPGEAPTGSGNARGAAASNDEAKERGKLTQQKLEVIKSIPHVKAVAAFQQLGQLEMKTNDDRSTYVNVIGTDLNSLRHFDHQFGQGSPSELLDTAVLNYGATLGITDQEALNKLYKRLNENPFNQALTEQLKTLELTTTKMYQRQVRLHRVTDEGKEYTSIPLRVASVLKKPKGRSEETLRFDKQIFVSLDTARMLSEQLKMQPNTEQTDSRVFNQVIVKVDDQANIKEVEKQIKKLKLTTKTNLEYKKQLESTFSIVRTIALGVGVFILIIASISIVVAMTMSTYQRRRQIGIMKVLGANLRQIRNMFIIEAALLGFIGGLIGVMFSYWIVWAINGVTNALTPDGSGEGIIFITPSYVPIGIAFAIFTGVISGIYPALSASRTDALTAIKRD
ncbi:ABC transporter permease [Paenibacillus sp. 481]|uniref:ABC transporter permease n=1 Tax=Paenibacillus sp. 481 TaxID=2835869 RepID=UPI001E62672A|nr:FtsX-like permease family protein [Paenibacillus sp. 481]UHA72645.1 ABC transporter permease [Paenibacillus sp. 481]